MAFPDLTSRLAVRFALITLGALLALLILVRFATITLGEEDPANGRGAMMSDSVPVIVTPVTMRTEEVRIEAVGTARAMKSVTLFPEVGGEVTAVNFNAGDRVEKGDIPIELDARQERLDVEAARNQLANAQQILTRYDEAGEGAVAECLRAAALPLRGLLSPPAVHRAFHHRGCDEIHKSHRNEDEEDEEIRA